MDNLPVPFLTHTANSLFAFWILISSLAYANDQPPRRIVSLSLASDEILLELLQSCDQNLSRLAAVSIMADNPNISNSVALAKGVTSRVHSEPEGILRLKPDLVVIASFNSQTLRKLLETKRIPTIYLSSFSSSKDIISNISALSKATGCERYGQSMIEKLTLRLKEIQNRSKIAPSETAIGYSSDGTTMAKGTLFDELLTINNLINLPSQAGLVGWPKISPEQISKWNPDWIILPCSTEKECDDVILNIKKNTAWKKLQAVTKNRFITSAEKDLQTTSHFFGTEFKRPSAPK